MRPSTKRRWEEEEVDSGDDADAPRISQWVDEDEIEQENHSSSTGAGPSRLNTLQEGLSSLPMGALRRANRVLKNAEPSEDSESEDPDADGSQNDSDEKSINQPTIREEKHKTKKDLAKRTNKHAPMEMSSKKPVTRRRTVVDVQRPEVRDPRFLPMTGELSVEKFQSNYKFLNANHESELKTLRENLKRARKLLPSTPRDLRPERESEVSRLELAVKRAESIVNRDKQERAGHAALAKLKKEEDEKRKQGKGDWWMKKSATKEVLVKARYDALAAEGGQSAVKKAIEKKRKKIGQKEKRSRPFVKGSAGSSDRPQKRRKVG